MASARLSFSASYSSLLRPSYSSMLSCANAWNVCVPAYQHHQPSVVISRRRRPMRSRSRRSGRLREPPWMTPWVRCGGQQAVASAV